jgi:AcrR family transcriptional regulator
METVRGRSEGTRERILAAARKLFLERGLRATAMEAIARQAQVAKPTLYAHYPDKDAVYAALIGLMLTEKHAAFAAALAGPGTAIERVTAALVAKYCVLAAALDNSPHAEELIHAHHRAEALFAESEAEIGRVLAGVLAEAGVGEPQRLARLLCDASFGLVRERGAVPDADVALLVERLLAPDLA